jgi:hypothetical protein
LPQSQACRLPPPRVNSDSIPNPQYPSSPPSPPPPHSRAHIYGRWIRREGAARVRARVGLGLAQVRGRGAGRGSGDRSGRGSGDRSGRAGLGIM